MFVSRECNLPVRGNFAMVGGIAMQRSDSAKLSLCKKACETSKERTWNEERTPDIHMIFTPQRCTVGIEVNGV